MTSDTVLQIIVRDATQADLPTLTAIKGSGTAAIHSDRLRDAKEPGFRYLVLLADADLIGFACLISRRPSYWSDADDHDHLPQIVDLQITESCRGQGYGSALLRALEAIAAEAGFTHLYLSVDPINNLRAYQLYCRLGYHPEQAEPYHKAWKFTDSQGIIHSGEDWIVDLVKQISV